MSTVSEKRNLRKIETSRQYLLGQCWETLYTSCVPMINDYTLKSQKKINYDWNIYLHTIDSSIKQICKSYNMSLNENPYIQLNQYLTRCSKLNTSREICNELQLLINILTTNPRLQFHHIY